jgi:hypothetical protein
MTPGHKPPKVPLDYFSGRGIVKPPAAFFSTRDPLPGDKRRIPEKVL